jgi:predicted metalloenzyme YecM
MVMVDSEDNEEYSMRDRLVENMSTIESIIEKIQERVLEVDDFCYKYGLVGLVKVDHIGIKCSSNDIYERQRKIFEHSSRFIYQSIISKRRISVIGLDHGIYTSVGTVDYLELSDQKPDASQVDVVDHIRILPIGISYDELCNYLNEKGISLKEVVRPHHTTHDIVLQSGFIIRLTQEMLVNKIKREEMV